MASSAIVVGAGFGGIAAAIELRRAGVAEITVLERGADVGGVWQHNTYPGAACDVPSHLYSYSFAPNPRWGRRFALQGEIRDYVRDAAARGGVLERVRCGVEAKRARWLEDDGVWEVECSDATRRAELLVTACGQLSRPEIPRIAGIESFAGEAFHSSGWRHDLDLRGKRVGVIGTGASAIQFVPRIQSQVASLTVVQRTAPWILPKLDRAYSPLAKRLFASVPALQSAGRFGLWAALEVAIAGFVGHEAVLSPFAAVGRAHLRRQVPDARLRELLTPRFTIGCKRILLSSDWYPTLTKPNVELVAQPIACADEHGIELADGSRRELDVLIYGTGFSAHDFVAPMQVEGRDGQTLVHAWDGLPNAWHGLSVPGFPNLFLMYGPNTFGGSGSAIYVLESQARHVAAAARAMQSRRAHRIEVRADAHERFLSELRQRQRSTVWATGGCTSWYLDEQGRDPTNWPGYTIEYRRRTSRIDPTVYELAA
ncbi:MAG TPA: NAD(P)/FAD-dependent oxidoreductase [Solirubrobacteraceae bacterium]|jgi:cation diffusion facilitator CzcD-associated flavoprotein CzcO